MVRPQERSRLNRGSYRQNAAEEVFDYELQQEWEQARAMRYLLDVEEIVRRALEAIRGGKPRRCRWKKTWWEMLKELLLGS
jgi:hypothetical protein